MAGLLTQATGPPQSGAGVGVGIFRGGYGFLGIPKIKKLDLPRMLVIQATPNNSYFGGTT